MRAEGIEVAVSQVWRILTAMDIDLSRVRGWLNRRDDPTFSNRVRDVCGLYLNPPERALVLSVDEKTSIQAKERRYRDQPAGPANSRAESASTSVTAPPACLSPCSSASSPTTTRPPKRFRWTYAADPLKIA